MRKIFALILISFLSLNCFAGTAPQPKCSKSTMVKGAVVGAVVGVAAVVGAVALSPVATVGGPAAYAVFGLSNLVATNAAGIAAASAITAPIMGGSGALVACIIRSYRK